ncbi:MAG: ABC transporter ATP-binding protein [Acidimicrobiia bacterium]
MSRPAVAMRGVSKNFRIYHERNRYIKATLLRGRRARYEEFWALKDVTFEVPHGATLGFIGSNGSGKTTLLKCLTGIYVPERGEVSVDGNVAALLELGAGFHAELTGRENVYLNGAILGMSKRDVERNFDSIVDFAGLARFIDSPVKNYSSGMVVRLGFSIATHVHPEILLIDEVLSVGDQEFQRRSADKIDEFRREGRTIVVVSHSLELVRQLCRDVVWLDRGGVRAMGPADEVISAYTGGRTAGAAAPAAPDARRSGTGDARIQAISILDDAGVAVTEAASGAPLVVRCELTAHARLESPVLHLAISTQGGAVAWAGSTQRGTASIRALDGPATIDVRFDALRLLEGDYRLSARLSDASGGVDHDRLDDWCALRVRGSDPGQSGIAALEPRWTVARQHR